METDRLGGTTYTFANVDAFLANNADSTSSTSATSATRASFNNGATGARHIEQEYYVGFAQDEWRIWPEVHAELRPAVRLLHAADGEPTTASVKFNIDTGIIEPSTTPVYQSKKNNFQPRLSANLRADEQDRVPRRASGSSSAPARPRTRSSRSKPTAISTTVSNASVPGGSGRPCLRVELRQQPEQPRHTSRAPTPTSTRCRSRSTSTPRRCSRSWPGSMVATAAYVGSQGRNLFLRSVANQIIGVCSQNRPDGRGDRDPRVHIVTAQRGRDDRQHQRPYAEVDYKTSGGHDSYNALQLSLTRRSTQRPDDERAVHARATARATQPGPTRR